MIRLQWPCYPRRAARTSAVLLAVLLGTACGRNAPATDEEPSAQPAIPLTDVTEPEPAQTALPPLPQESIPARPGTIEDTLHIEGMAEPTRARLVQTPADFPVRFSTYVPTGIDTQFDGRGDSASVRFAAAFTGRPDPNAYMHVRLYGATITRAVARNAATDFVRSRAPWRDEAQPAEPPSWGVEAYTFQYSGDGNVPYTGRLVLGRHADRYFHVLTHYPAEYGDGLGPRFQRMLEQWRWEDTGRPLVQR